MKTYIDPKLRKRTEIKRSALQSIFEGAKMTQIARTSVARSISVTPTAYLG
jgi:hypothetical protein